MTYRDWVASVLAAAVLVPLLLHLRRSSPKRSAARRALLEHPHRPYVQWPWRPYDWERDGQ